MSEERFDRIDLTLTTINERLGAMDKRFDGIDQRLGEMKSDMDRRFDELGGHMRDLHEDAIARIKTVAEGYVALDEKMDRRFDEMKELIGQRLDPLEDAVKWHSTVLDRLEKERG